MKFGSGNKALLQDMAQMKDANYASDPMIAEIYGRLSDNRDRFEDAVEKNLKAAAGIESLDLELGDHTKTMVDAVSEIVSAAEVINTASQDTASAVGSVAEKQEVLTNTVVTASEETSDMYGKIEEGQQALSEIRKLSDETIGMSKTMQSDMDALSSVITRMNEVISGIDAVSSQTNLLALNASIEAARAGEAGRGFAVVAEEIRKLAEQTQTLTANMGEFVEGIRGASEKSIVSAKDTIEALGSMTEKIDNAWNLNEENKQNISRINDAICALASVSEDINCSMDQVQSNVSSMEEQCGVLQNNATEMDEVIGTLQNVSEPINEAKQAIGAANKAMGQMAEDPFLAVKNETLATELQQIKNS